MLGLLPLGLVAASAQTPPRAPLADPPRGRRPGAPPVSRDTVKERDKELESIRAEHKRTLENEAKLKREIEFDRRRPAQVQSAADRHRRARA